VVLVGAIVVQATVLFALAKRSPTDTPYMALKMVYLAVYPLAVCAAIALSVCLPPFRKASADGGSPRGGGQPDIFGWAALVILTLIIGPGVIRAPRDRTVLSMPLYRAGQWARVNVPPNCVEYLVGNADTAYWLHLAVLGNPRASTRTADVETFDAQRALLRWIAPDGLPYAIADLNSVPRDVRDASDVIAKFDNVAVLKRRGTRQRCG
jgi:hypothetical protein